MLFQNLYEKILVSQKLKTKQENHLINSIDIIKQKNVKIVILSHIQKEKEKKNRYSHHPFVFVIYLNSNTSIIFIKIKIKK